MRHDEGRLTAVMSKHVDDLKMAGIRQIIREILAAIQRVFGELKIEWHSFSNCGVRHIQDQQTKEITLDQIVYVGNLRPIVHAQERHSKPEDLCCPELHNLYMSLLGAAAYLAHTRLDVVVFICALQRHTSKPQVQHVRKLN